MPDVRALAPAAWGLAGALAWGFCMLIAAFRTPGAAPGARTTALLNLALGVFLGPLAAVVFGDAVTFLIPRLDPKAVEVTLGVVAVPIFPRAAEAAQNRLLKALNGDGK